MRNTATSARVYRFHELVALNIRLPSGFLETVYIKPDMAFNLATMLHDAATDTYTQPAFSKSKLGTYRTVPCDDGAMDFRMEKE